MSSFDYEEHARTYVNYLEVIIRENGEVEYAIPSHQRKLIQMYCDDHNITEEELWEIIPIYESPEHWMCYHGKYIAVWYEGIICPKDISDAQIKVLSRMIETKILSNKFTSSIVSYDEEHNMCRSSQEVIAL